jgi:hypothetical protein
MRIRDQHEFPHGVNPEFASKTENNLNLLNIHWINHHYLLIDGYY